MTLKVGDLKNFDDNVNILLSGGEVFSLKIVSTDRDTVFLEAYLEEASKKRKRRVKPKHNYIVIEKWDKSEKEK